MIALFLVTVLAAGSPTAQAERLAGEALAEAQLAPAPALAKARRALLLTRDFDPTAFVAAGRKGELVEDEYLRARHAYRRHRALLYQAVGVCLANMGRAGPAGRYLARAQVLAPSAERTVLLGRSLLARGRGTQALALFRREAQQGPLADAGLELFAQAVDAVGLPSAQEALDRFRLEALGPGVVEPLPAPLKAPASTRLSTGGPLRFEAGPTVLYFGEASCRTCSADLEVLKRVVPAGVGVVLVPEDGDRDQALRRVVEVYRHGWPVLLGRGGASSLRLTSGSVVVVGRQGWTSARVLTPLADNLPRVLSVLKRAEVSETVPRPRWNGRPPEPLAAAPAAALLPEGWAPAEDADPPAAFGQALDAYRGGRPAEALRLLNEVEAGDRGWLLPPEARFNRALCLEKLGRVAEARSLLLGIGDSRFQAAVDRALEALGGGSR